MERGECGRHPVPRCSADVEGGTTHTSGQEKSTMIEGGRGLLGKKRLLDGCWPLG